ncbi:mevalonate kinase [Candidatus Gottesmanbacteria bacterium]|nr:mevalonate kinase [Candidatus Gottesmanbacteria bacterium]
MVVVSVPGKIHLMGEHAVVYGKPALLAAINLRLRVTVEEGKRGADIISGEPSDYIRHAIEIIRQEYKLAGLPPMKITVQSDIPAGYHLGSSAAVAVGTVGAVTYFLKKIWNPEAINQIAYEVEKKMHGNPSGGDNTIVTMGGLIWYRRELEFLKSIWQLPFKIPENLNHFFLINTGKPKETTGEMVRFVNVKCQMSNVKYKTLFDRNEEQAKRVAVAIKEGNEKELMDAMKVGERTLEGMGVVSRKVIPLIRKIEKAGGAAKILGGGGRTDGVGFLLCYHHAPKKAEHLSQKVGWPMLPIRLGEEGIRLENNKSTNDKSTNIQMNESIV